MRTTIDIPTGLYTELKARAANEQTSVKALILRGVQTALGDAAPQVKQPRLKKPIVNSGTSGSISLTNDQIDELIFS